MALFITKSDGKPINISLIQTIFVKDNNLVYYMKNGEQQIEEYSTETEVTARYESVKTSLLSSGGVTPSLTSDVSFNAVTTTGDLIGIITIGSNSINIYSGIDNKDVTDRITTLETNVTNLENTVGNVNTVLDEINGEVI